MTVPFSCINIILQKCSLTLEQSNLAGLLGMLNCSIVGLAAVHPSTSRVQISETGLSVVTLGQGEHAPSCIGAGFICDIDVNQGLFLIHTPIPLKVLQERRIFTFVASIRNPTNRTLNDCFTGTFPDGEPYYDVAPSFANGLSANAKSSKRTNLQRQSHRTS